MYIYKNSYFKIFLWIFRHTKALISAIFYLKMNLNLFFQFFHFVGQKLGKHNKEHLQNKTNGTKEFNEKIFKL